MFRLTPVGGVIPLGEDACQKQIKIEIMRLRQGRDTTVFHRNGGKGNIGFAVVYLVFRKMIHGALGKPITQEFVEKGMNIHCLVMMSDNNNPIDYRTFGDTKVQEKQGRGVERVILYAPLGIYGDTAGGCKRQSMGRNKILQMTQGAMGIGAITLGLGADFCVKRW